MSPDISCHDPVMHRLTPSLRNYFDTPSEPSKTSSNTMIVAEAAAGATTAANAMVNVADADAVNAVNDADIVGEENSVGVGGNGVGVSDVAVGSDTNTKHETDDPPVAADDDTADGDDDDGNIYPTYYYCRRPIDPIVNLRHRIHPSCPHISSLPYLPSLIYLSFRTYPLSYIQALDGLTMICGIIWTIYIIATMIISTMHGFTLTMMMMMW